MKKHLFSSVAGRVPAGAATLLRRAAMLACWSALCSPALGAAPQAAAAAPDPGIVLPAAIPQLAVRQGLALVEKALQLQAPAGSRLLITAGAIDSRLQLAPCSAAEPHLSNAPVRAGRSRMGLRCTEGARWHIQLPLQVQAWAPALVAAQALPVGTLLLDEHLKLGPVDWALHDGLLVAPAVVGASTAAENGPVLFSKASGLTGRVLARPLLPGQPLRAADLQRRQWFEAGSRVNIVATGAGFSVSAEGQALSPGYEGQSVRVRTEAGRIVVGQPVDERRVELRL